MQQLESNIRAVDVSAMVTINTVQGSIATHVANIQHLNWNFLLSQYTVGFKQIDSLWRTFDSKFSLYFPIPKSSKDATIDVPGILSTMIPAEDETNIVITADPAAKSPADLVKAAQKYNEALTQATSSFRLRIEVSKLKAEQKEKDQFQSMDIEAGDVEEKPSNTARVVSGKRKLNSSSAVGTEDELTEAKQKLSCLR